LAVVGVMVATLLFMLIPATLSTHISPSTIMRYE
jgi:hypothetical protein